MRVRKRDNSIQEFSKEKIIIAVGKAMKAGGHYSEKLAQKIADDVVERFKDIDIIPICDIEIAVFDALVRHGKKHIARLYEGYRAIREFQRNIENETDKQIMSMLDGKDEYWTTENANKNAELVSTKRDYMAGILSKQLAKKYIFSPDVLEADSEAIIKIHDQDYAIQHLTNCELINLEDMLQYGTCINGIHIDKPHKLITAATIATQIILGVTSASYGGTTVTLSHLAPFVRDSYNLYVKKYRDYGLAESDVVRLAQIDIKKEISDAVQTFNYQLNSMANSNGYDWPCIVETLCSIDVNP